MKKFFKKHTYYIICVLFIISLFSVVFFKEYLVNELAKKIMNYGFWYFFGVFSGFSLAIYIFKNRS
jgi:uncharacterized membrane protein required for colicin V production